MSALTRTPATRTTDRRGLAIGAGFAAQGLGYAAIMTSLPTSAAHWRLDATGVALIVLGTCVAAAVGSLLADLVAVRRGSRAAMCLALLVQAATILGIAVAPVFPVFLAAIVLYGVGLGMLDAAQNMQGVLHERAGGRPLMGRFYAAYTAAAIVGALCMSAFLASSGAVTGALVVAAVVDAAVLVVGALWLDPTRAAREAGARPAAAARLPRGRLVAVGTIVLVAFMLDSAVSTWSTAYLQTGLGVAAAIAPLGYAAYQGAILLTRLATDPLEKALGRERLAALSLGAGVLGLVLVALVPGAAGAVIGFAIAGAATGALVPLAFSAAGGILPARSDEVIARVNLFNYAGAVAGAVVLGLVASGPSLGPAFLVPAVALLLCAPLLRTLRHVPDSRPAD
ncbi:Sugar phosphate permease [Rathayibacter oskolensis]|uniref:Sugar phosphate permease n=1 Tax=Rathayibacter oskolensis TaxID=1891671 RepID=A0A1X7NXZ8_9MICO|nr:MFS transporter [Rathayibacter oskolensis]SMH43156.1 Sugar phosphate permease [Rathayibacter oskolensis]